MREKEIKMKEIENMIQTVLVAIPREIRAKEFYLDAAKKSLGEKSKITFESLAEQEKAHEASLKKMLKDLEKELKRIKDGK